MKEMGGCQRSSRQVTSSLEVSGSDSLPAILLQNRLKLSNVGES